jgi:phosphatidylserine/phosphatidylglycerophosphate/cardiolipin synthase-like enzyme
MPNDPIIDPLVDAPPKPLTDRLAYGQSGGLATFRFPGDRHRSEASRWFINGPGVHPVRDGNEVMYLVGGAETFAEMARVMRTAKDATKNHFIYLLGWSMDLGFPFDSAGNTAASILKEASDVRGVQVRAMAWAGIGAARMLGFLPDPEKAVSAVNAMKNGQAFKDTRALPNGSHHQKVVIVNGEEGLTAFCGGIDIDPNRVFPMGVNGSNFNGAPFHDVHCRVRGPAAWDVLQTFIERWTDFVSAMRLTGSEKAPLLGPNLTLDQQPKPGKLHVQMGRTYPNGAAHNLAGPPNMARGGYAFAPTGETTVSQMFFHAIDAAKRFIYIEDQYLVHKETSDALVKALPRLRHLTIIFPHSDLTDLPHIWEHRKAFIAPLRSAAKDKVHVFVRFPFGAQVARSYVHAKTWVFDDQYAIIGTANVNRRSWTHDSEIVVGIYDESTNDHAAYTFAHRLRVRLWAEHLNMNTPDGHAALADAVASTVHWKLPGTNVAEYDENSGHDDLSNPINHASWDDSVDPEGR